MTTAAPTSGQWFVTTLASDYVFDFDAMTMMRTPREPDANMMRRDGERARFRRVLGWREGSEGLEIEFCPYADDDGYWTTRFTTRVCSINSLN